PPAAHDAECWDWDWDEVSVARSAVDPDGFGLVVREGGAVDWSRLDRPVLLPFVGRATEVEDSLSARALNCILHGAFDVVPFSALPCGSGCRFVLNGIFLESVAAGESCHLKTAALPPETQVVQVPLCDRTEGGGGVVSIERKDRAVVYLLQAHAAVLLHIPPHIFAVLQCHTDHHHADRSFATHVLEYRRHAASVMIVNAHPVYGCAAYAAGAINEPTPHAPPTFEVRQLALTLAPEQDGEALQHWRAFAAAFPDVLDSGNAPFFVTAQYNTHYLRTYDSWGYIGTPSAVRLPPDTFARDDALAAAPWPKCAAGWWNPFAQPLGRAVFERAGARRGGASAHPGVRGGPPLLPGGGGGAVSWRGVCFLVKEDRREIVAARRRLNEKGQGTHLHRSGPVVAGGQWRDDFTDYEWEVGGVGRGDGARGAAAEEGGSAASPSGDARRTPAKRASAESAHGGKKRPQLRRRAAQAATPPAKRGRSQAVTPPATTRQGTRAARALFSK
ncbi:hypothetical protein EMIHUDRAFT_122849, partial [Emiliania huxleyi CCMP1516]|uniref:Uncharacterized protein n=2 Tax=Emiliania huxleyi TaxID=2903 RepID=A0A0D3KD87_EMIH1